MPRTTCIFHTKEDKEIGNISIQSGENPIYNMLVAYSELDPQIGYTQGMNFLAALLYLATRDEIIAFDLLIKVMFDLNWREVYLD